MSQHDFHIEQGVYDTIRDMSRDYGWSYISAAFGYSGEATMKNIVNQGAHSLPFTKLVQGMKHFALKKDFRLHRFVLGNRHHILEVDEPVDNRSIQSLHNELLHQMCEGEKAIDAGYTAGIEAYYRFLLHVVEAIRLQVKDARVVFSRRCS